MAAKLAQQKGRLGPPIYKHLMSTRCSDKDGITLAHIKEGDVQATVGLGGNGAPQGDRGQAHRRHPEPGRWRSQPRPQPDAHIRVLIEPPSGRQNEE
ncbi:MAG: hypothetical protein C4310_01330, partial [Chloroflexota bacterium]